MGSFQNFFACLAEDYVPLPNPVKAPVKEPNVAKAALSSGWGDDEPALKTADSWDAKVAVSNDDGWGSGNTSSYAGDVSGLGEGEGSSRGGDFSGVSFQRRSNYGDDGNGGNREYGGGERGKRGRGGDRGGRGAGRGRGGDRGERGGGRARGGGRGGLREREFDRHNSSPREDRYKKETVGKGSWGDPLTAEDDSWLRNTEQADSYIAVSAEVDGAAVDIGSPSVEEESTEVTVLPRWGDIEEDEPMIFNYEEELQTLEEYLAEKAATKVKVDATVPARRANEGSDESQWKDAVLLKKDESDYFVAKPQVKPKKIKEHKAKVIVDIELNFAERDEDHSGRGGGRGRGGRNGRGGGRGRGGYGGGGFGGNDEEGADLGRGHGIGFGRGRGRGRGRGGLGVGFGIHTAQDANGATEFGEGGEAGVEGELAGESVGGGRTAEFLSGFDDNSISFDDNQQVVEW
ncbi:hypothetical protein HDU97_005506 [Phlyctochytrium planicorne]|nr:hypothetical protein HDU97_005506 [Phlyctochytrium planicorne]